MTTSADAWKPSNARTVVLDSFIPAPRGSSAVPPPLPNWPTKDPVDVLDYQFDISPAIIGNDGDAISTLDVTIEPAGPGALMMRSAKAEGSVATVWLAGGQAGSTYTLTLAITTVNGRTVYRSILLPVLNLSVPAVPTYALTTDSGGVVTDDIGSPMLIGP